MATVGAMLTTRKAMDTLEGFAATICADYVEKSNSTVCAPATKMMGDIVVPSLVEFYLSPDFFCSPRMMNYCDSPNYITLSADDYVNDQLSKKKEELKTDDFIDSLYDKIKADPKPRETIKTVHMSDNHIDFLYTPGTIADCTLPVCCNPVNGFTSDPDRSAGLYGDTRCDL